MSPPLRRASLALELAAGTCADSRALDAAMPAHLQRLIGCGPVFLAAVDPTTLHFTRASRVEIPDAAAAEFLAHEVGVSDVVKFRDLAGPGPPVDTLFQATHGDPRSSARWRDVIEPLGWGDELRVALQEGSRTWGFLCLHRMADERPFDGSDVAAARHVAPALAAALRRTALGNPDVEVRDHPPGPGVVVLDEDYVVRSMTGSAERWLELLGGDPEGVPIVIMSVSAQAVTTGRPAVSRTVTVDGRSVTVHASPLSGSTGDGVAVVLESSAPADALPAMTAAARLTPREADVADAVLRGLSGRAIARALDLSEHTVQDHLKSIYVKVGVRSRGELVARLLGN